MDICQQFFMYIVIEIALYVHGSGKTTAALENPPCKGGFLL